MVSLLPSRRPPHRTALCAVALSTILLAGCSGGDEEDRDDSGEDARASAGGDAALDPCTTTPRETDGLTEPGQVLCFGTPAVLPVDYSLGGTGTMRLAVTGVERGDDAIIDELITSGYPDWTSQSRDLWYVRAEAELLSEDEPGAVDGANPMTIISGLRSADGTSGEKGLVFPFDECEETTFGDGGGTAFETCLWAVLPPGTDGYAASWADTGDYLDGPVVWAPR